MECNKKLSWDAQAGAATNGTYDQCAVFSQRVTEAMRQDAQAHDAGWKSQDMARARAHVYPHQSCHAMIVGLIKQLELDGTLHQQEFERSHRWMRFGMLIYRGMTQRFATRISTMISQG